ncbi:MAG: hypothetical protein HY784_17440, partial [Chloroflexi bacterium]|nr:hypothetical protein [Chloroflexota bacterium]
MVKLEEGWLTVVLLCVIVTVAAWGIAAASWVPGLWTAWFTGVLGVLAGLALGKSRFSGPTAVLFATVYGAFCVGFLVSSTLQGGWHDRSLELVIRLNNFLYKAIYGGTSRDTLPFPVFVSYAFWAVGASGAWAVFRRGAVWPAVLPGGIALLINAYYYLGPARIDLYVAVYVLLALLLVARVSLLGREREWQSAHVAYNPEMRLDFLRAGLVLALTGVLIGWAGPGLAASPAAASAWQQVARPWGAVRELWMRLFASIRAYGQNVNDFYGDSLTLGGPSRLNDAPIMDVILGQAQDEFGLGGEGETSLFVPRYYWRAAAFDQYTDGRWTSGEGVSFKEFDPQAPPTLRPPIYNLRRDVEVTFISYVAAQSRLYVAPQPKWVDRRATF